MSHILIRAAFLGLLSSAVSARAATVDVTVTDAKGKPAPNAVVSLDPGTGGAMDNSQLPAQATIDQRQETFIPLVTIIRQGGKVVFTNHDTTMHQVYSFSPIKQFAFEIDENQRSEPVIFDKPGVASIGCNIHDQMITYVFVAGAPWAALTDANGRIHVLDVPLGTYEAAVWHPQLLPGRTIPTTTLTVSRDTRVTMTVPLLAAPPVKHTHMGLY